MRRRALHERCNLRDVAILTYRAAAEAGPSVSRYPLCTILAGCKVSTRDVCDVSWQIQAHLALESSLQFFKLVLQYCLLHNSLGLKQKKLTHFFWSR